MPITSDDALNRANELNNFVLRISRYELSNLLKTRKEISKILQSLFLSNNIKIPHMIKDFLEKDNFSEGIYSPIMILRPILSIFCPHRNPISIEKREKEFFELLEKNLKQNPSPFAIYEINIKLAEYRDNICKSLKYREMISSADRTSSILDYLSQEGDDPRKEKYTGNDVYEYDLNPIKEYFRLYKNFLNLKPSGFLNDNELKR